MEELVGQDRSVPGAMHTQHVMTDTVGWASGWGLDLALTRRHGRIHSGHTGEVIAGYRSAVAPGSLLVITHATIAPAAHPAGVERLLRVFREASTPLYPRSPGQIVGFFAGMDLLPADEDDVLLPAQRSSGLVPVDRWRAAGTPGPSHGAGALLGAILAGVGRKPGRPGFTRWQPPRRFTGRSDNLRNDRFFRTSSRCPDRSRVGATVNQRSDR